MRKLELKEQLDVVVDKILEYRPEKKKKENKIVQSKKFDEDERDNLLETK